MSRDLLEKAAKAAGLTGEWGETIGGWPCLIQPGGHAWQPQHDDGDAFRLMVALRMTVHVEDAAAQASSWIGLGRGEMQVCLAGDDTAEAVRRAIVRAAAAIGEAK